MDIRPTMVAAQGAFGLAAIVTPPGGSPVATTVFWLPSRTIEHPIGSDYRRAEPLRVLVIPTAGLPQAPPRGTVVSVPEYQGAAVTDWKVDSADRVDFDHFRAVMVPA